MNIKKHKRKIIYSLVAATAVASASAVYSLNQQSASFDQMSKQNAAVITQNLPPTPCLGLDEIWKHVYSGDPRKFSKPQDRLQVIEPCKTVIGTIVNAVQEADSDWHIRMDVQDKSLLNSYNISKQHSYLVVEPVCAHNPPTQKDVVQEGVCNGFSQSIFNPNMIGKKVEVVGAFVVDQEHHWQEIHPVLSITVIK